MATDIIFLLVAFGLVVAALFRAPEKVIHLGTLAKQGSWQPLAIFAACVALSAVLIAVAYITLEDNWTAEKKRVEAATAAEAQTLRDTLRDGLERQNQKLDKFASEQESLKAEVTRLQLAAGVSAVAATRPSRHAGMKTRDVTVYAVDKNGNDAMFVVFQFFADTAFWRFNDDYHFENAKGRAFNFSNKLDSSAYIDEMRTYDLVIGVGLASRTRNSIPHLADRRATTLCGLLHSKVSRANGPRILGVSIGEYGNLPFEDRASPKRAQRSVLIAGVSVKSDEVNEQDLFVEILREIRIPSISLADYSDAKPGKRPVWVETQRCADVFGHADPATRLDRASDPS